MGRNPLTVVPCPAVEYPRSAQAHTEEVDGVLSFFEHRGPRPGVMLDVGAHRGTSLSPFAERGWSIHAFEPDEANRSKLLDVIRPDWHVQVTDRLVADRSGRQVPFYSSPVSSGISSSIPFHASHQEASTVETIALSDYMTAAAIEDVNFLKIDTEGADIFVLRGFPFHRVTPDVVLCEFEDAKTLHRGYRTADIIHVLRSVGYDTIIVSEWHPIIEYGRRHDYSGLHIYDGTPVSHQTWGNLIAVRDPNAVPLMFHLQKSVVERTAG